MHNGFYMFVFFSFPLSLPLPATKCYPSQKPKQHMYHITNLSHGSTSLLFSGLESPGSRRPSWTEDMQNMYLSAMWITCGRKALWLMPMC